MPPSLASRAAAVGAESARRIVYRSSVRIELGQLIPDMVVYGSLGAC